ncbi:MAG: glutathione S-transferase [Halieaceae bacterium]|jgi:glutathione S-transferase|nr:glutathione S-transferase [Halieaceae bacterium]
MKIYDVADFPNPARVRIALAEKNATDQVTFVPVDVMGGEHRTEDFRARNPAAGVPVLELDDGTFIAESTAITEYIDNHFQGISLTGTGARERAVVHMMQRRAEAMVIDAVGAYFHHATDGLGPELETYQNKEWGEKQRETAINGFRYFDTVLGASAFVAGDNFSMADITLFCGLGFADFAGIEIPAELVNLAAWREKIAARPSIAA